MQAWFPNHPFQIPRLDYSFEPKLFVFLGVAVSVKNRLWVGSRRSSSCGITRNIICNRSSPPFSPVAVSGGSVVSWQSTSEYRMLKLKNNNLTGSIRDSQRPNNPEIPRSAADIRCGSIRFHLQSPWDRRLPGSGW